MAELLVVQGPVGTELLETAQQGPPGGPGAPGGSLLAATAAVSLSGHMAVVYNAAGQLLPASADQIFHALRLVGITTGAASTGAQATVQRQDVIEHSGWAWTVDQPVYLGLAGALVQTVPGSAVFGQVMGHALSPTRLLVAIQPPVLLA